jgi:putative transposase
MRKPRFTEEQIALALRQVDAGVPVAELCRKLGISEPTFYAWKKKYAGMGIVEMRRVKQLEDENRRLNGLVADLTLDRTRIATMLTSGSRSGPAAHVTPSLGRGTAPSKRTTKRTTRLGKSTARHQKLS